MYTCDDVLVSINCIAYNHEKYIRDALESFLMQKTNFRYEILIHDDASTDKTADIIKMYEKKFPSIIRPIYQNTNQYSRGVKVLFLNMQRAQGKYIALCEGDDYWTNPLKLQMQVDYMENHPDCSLCVHSAVIVNGSKKKVGELRPARRDTAFYSKDAIIGGGSWIATDSMLFPYEKWRLCPDFYDKWSVVDYPLQIFLSTVGDVHYIDKLMSAYRVGIAGQWSAALRDSTEKFRNHLLQTNRQLEELDEFTGYKYTNAINKRIRMNHIFVGDLSVLGWDVYFSLPFTRKILAGLQYCFPSLYSLAKKIKGTF